MKKAILKFCPDIIDGGFELVKEWPHETSSEEIFEDLMSEFREIFFLEYDIGLDCGVVFEEELVDREDFPEEVDYKNAFEEALNQKIQGWREDGFEAFVSMIEGKNFKGGYVFLPDSKIVEVFRSKPMGTFWSE